MANEKTLKLRLSDYRLSGFDTGVEDIVIVSGGTEIPAKHEEAIRDAAKKSGVKLKKM